MTTLRRTVSALLIAVLALVTPAQSHAYSLLTHLQLVDLLWTCDIVPLLKARFPNTNLEWARTYAYGGALMPDAGYYPRAVQYVSDYTHYVRPGDFITNLFRNATDGYELAFAIGALTHYVGDIKGHSLATNPSVAITFAYKFAPAKTVTYEQDTDAHKQVEIGFDVNALNHQRFAPKKLVDKTRLDIPLQQLTYAFYQTYGVHQDFTLTKSSLNVYHYRNNARTLLPSGIYAVANAHRDESPTENENDANFQDLKAMINKVAAEDHWSDYGYRPGPLSDTFATVIKVDPKMKLAQVKIPNSETQQKYVSSVVTTVRLVQKILKTPDPSSPRFVPLWPADETEGAPKPLPNFNLDTGNIEQPRSYKLTDDAYFRLLNQIVAFHDQNPSWPLPLGVKEDILSYFSDLDSTASYDFIARGESTKTGLAESLDKLRAIFERDGCPDRTFGMSGTWRDPHPPLVLIPALCDQPVAKP